MTRCFQISQNYLRWFSCLFGKFKAFLKISWGNFSRRFRQLFRLISETCVTTRLDGSGRKLKDKEEPYSHQTILGDVLSMNRNFQETFVKNNRNIWEIKLWKHNFIKSQVSSRKTTNILDELWKLIFALSNSYHTEKSRWMPLKKYSTKKTLETGNKG